MKTIKLITLAGAIMVTAAVTGAPSAYREPEWTVDIVIRLIRAAESRGSEDKMYPHPDGVSRGPWGLTPAAREELVRRARRSGMIEYTADNEPEQELDAREYLCLQLTMWSHLPDHPRNLIEAAGWYHAGGDSEKRKAYRLKLRHLYERGMY